jgi:hypothetical protein
MSFPLFKIEIHAVLFSLLKPCIVIFPSINLVIDEKYLKTSRFESLPLEFQHLIFFIKAKYPHDLLCGQAGINPTSAKIKMTSKIVPSDMVGSFL